MPKEISIDNESDQGFVQLEAILDQMRRGCMGSARKWEASLTVDDDGFIDFHLRRSPPPEPSTK
jgi:hypothetical protein